MIILAEMAGLDLIIPYIICFVLAFIFLFIAIVNRSSKSIMAALGCGIGVMVLCYMALKAEPLGIEQEDIVVSLIFSSVPVLLSIALFIAPKLKNKEEAS